MPCSDGGVPYGPSQEERDQLNFAKRAEPMLCSACRVLERLNYDFDENPELSEWWDSHKRKDAARLESERKAAERDAWERKQVAIAVAKPFNALTKQEINLLKKHKYI